MSMSALGDDVWSLSINFLLSSCLLSLSRHQVYVYMFRVCYDISATKLKFQILKT